MKVLFFIPAWERRDITRICYEGLKRVIADAPPKIECEAFIVASNDADEKLADEFDFTVYRHENHPLGAKFNAGMKEALKKEWDYVWQLNSDDVLSTDIWKAFLPFFQRKTDFWGVERLYFYDMPTGRMKTYRYFDGCGIRVIKRALVEKAGWCKRGRAKQSMIGAWAHVGAGESGYYPAGKVENSKLFDELSARRKFMLWPDEAGKGLDNWSRNRIFWANGLSTLRFPPADKWGEPLVVDIKSGANIWQYNDCPDGKELNDAQKAKALRKFPELEKVVR